MWYLNWYTGTSTGDCEEKVYVTQELVMAQIERIETMSTTIDPLIDLSAQVESLGAIQAMPSEQIDTEATVPYFDNIQAEIDKCSN